MAIKHAACFRVILLGTASVLALAGCGEAFTATGGGTSTSTSTGGGGTSTGGGGSTSTAGNGGTGGSGGTTITPDCTNGDHRACFTVDATQRNVGSCHDGQNVCVDGKWSETCDGEGLPSTEVCGDAFDFDCDGNPDTGCPCTGNQSESCYPADDPLTEGVGTCKAGTKTCMDGVWGGCVGAVVPQPETCENGSHDDDCNGTMDDIPGAGANCPTGQSGVCAAGSMKCSGGQLTCLQNVQASDETCDTLDNDCNGTPDDVKGACNVQVAGGMCPGSYRCAGGALTCGQNVYFFDNFSNGGDAWTLQGEWNIGATFIGGDPPDVGFADPASDHTTGGNVDNKLAGVVIGGNINQEPHGPDYLTLKPRDTNKNGTVFLTYYRWLNTVGAPDMLDFVEVSTNGNTWVPLANVSITPIQESSWTVVTHDITAYKSATFQVRFGVKVVNQVPAVSSWNIDDVAITSCPPN